jgi:hypothetical protein
MPIAAAGRGAVAGTIAMDRGCECHVTASFEN